MSFNADILPFKIYSSSWNGVNKGGEASVLPDWPETLREGSTVLAVEQRMHQHIPHVIPGQAYLLVRYLTVNFIFP